MRIKRILILLEQIWNENPDMRLGQLIGNVAKFDTLTGDIRDLFLIEDNVMFDRLVSVLAFGWRPHHKEGK